MSIEVELDSSDLLVDLNSLDASSLVRSSKDELTGLQIDQNKVDITLVANNQNPILTSQFNDDKFLFSDKIGDDQSLIINSDANIDIVDELDYDSSDKFLFKENLKKRVLDSYKRQVKAGKTVQEDDLIDDIDIFQVETEEGFLSFIKNRKVGQINNYEEEGTAFLSSPSGIPKLNQFFNLKKISWLPITHDGKDLLDKEGNQISVEFSVQEVLEDETRVIPIGNYQDKEYSEYINDLYISEYSLTGKDSWEIPEWIEIDYLSPTPELVGQDALIISQLIVNDQNNPEICYLEIHVHDYREDGLGLVGLELDLGWNHKAIELIQKDYSASNVFDIESLPLFQNLGDQVIDTQTQKVNELLGIGAAALPNAGRGKALGNLKDFNPQTLFARIPFKKLDDTLNYSFDIHPTLMPPASAVELDQEKIIVLDSKSSEVAVLVANPDQEAVGSYAFTISSKENSIDIPENIALTVREVNDLPEAVSEKYLPDNYLEQNLKQDEILKYDVKELFIDSDHDLLDYELINPPKWISLDDMGYITCKPGNQDVGCSDIIIQARDNAGGVATQKVIFNVININDSPTSSAQIKLPSLLQGQSFTYELEPDTFRDPDLLIDSNEKLSYQILQLDGEDSDTSWIKIDTNKGTISGKAQSSNVGNNNFLIRAIDSYGLFHDQLVTLQVENINDAPRRTKALQSFLEGQYENATIDHSVNLEDSNSIFVGIEKSYDLNKWFSDDDLNLVEDEFLEITVELDSDDFGILELPSKEIEWLKYDNDKHLLTVSPNSQHSGEHILRVRAIDSKGLIASAIVPINVRTVNRSPTINIPNEDYLLENIRYEGVNNLQAITSDTEQINGVNIELIEESDFTIKLPTSIFYDPDLGLDPLESIQYELKYASAGKGVDIRSKPFVLDSNTLTIKGNTQGLAINNYLGKSVWELILTAKDNKGEIDEFYINLSLQRTALETSFVNHNDNKSWMEGEEISLLDLIDLDYIKREEDYISILIRKDETEKYELGIDNLLIQKSEKISLLNNGDLLIRDNSAEINQTLEEIKLIFSEGIYAYGDFELGLEVSSELGQTSLVSDTISKTISFSLNQVTNQPHWVEQLNLEDNIRNLEPLELLKISSIYNAKKVDKNENLGYEMIIDVNHNNIFIGDSHGEMLGERQGNKFILDEEEWNKAIVRSYDRYNEDLSIILRAFSFNKDTGNKAYAEDIAIKWKASPYLDKVSEFFIRESNELRKSGSLTYLDLNIDKYNSSNSIIINLELPVNSNLILDPEKFDYLQENIEEKTNFQNHKILLKEEIVSDSNSIKIPILIPDSEKGDYVGEVSIIETFRNYSDLSNFREEILTDIDKGLAQYSKKENFQWNVIEAALKPEYLAHNLETNEGLNFNSETGQLIIPVRRGNDYGIYNPEEIITITISNIPKGYKLAQNINGSFEAVGATDIFGTMTIFNEVADSESNLSEFSNINQGNLYLVSDNNLGPSDISSSTHLNITIFSRIISEGSLDSRSEIVTTKVPIGKTISALPKLAFNTNYSFVDPLILDLSNNGLNLTSFKEDGYETKFQMLPANSPISTNWLKPQFNRDSSYNSAFIVSNSTDNDTNDVISISSITELFSEYYASISDIKTYLSGSSALSTFDSNFDGILDYKDKNWESIQLWFDDGDAISSPSELSPISNYLSSIDLDGVDIITEQPFWANTNSILRSLNAKSLSTIDENVKVYDVGLNIAPEIPPTINFTLNSINEIGQINESTNYFSKENFDPLLINLQSNQSDSWIKQGLDSLTLVRVGGLPNEIIPDVGIKDSRGDWLFTWSDLISNEGTIQFIPEQDWSGEANISFLVSQLNPDGSIISSDLKTVGINVEASADKPLLGLSDGLTNEDEPILLKSLISISELLDKDGSESIKYHVSNLPQGCFLYSKSNNDSFLKVEAINNIYSFEESELSSIFIIPPENFSGQLEFLIKAIAIEESNNSFADNTQTAILNVRPIADSLNPYDFKTKNATLKEQGSLLFKDFFLDTNVSKILSDQDGSEHLRLELIIPHNITIQKIGESNWIPISDNIIDNRRYVYIDSKDLAELEFKDQGLINVDDITFKLRFISREKVNGDIYYGDTIDQKITYIRNAIPPAVEILEKKIISEGISSIKLSELLRVKPNNEKDTITYFISSLPDGFSIYDKSKDHYLSLDSEAYYIIEDLDNCRLELPLFLSGEFSFDLAVSSTPSNGGDIAVSPEHTINFSITPVANKPEMILLEEKISNFTIEDNGWLRVNQIIDNIKTPDDDGSEQMSILIDIQDQHGDRINIPWQSKISVSNHEIDDGRIKVDLAEIQNLNIFIGEVAEDLNLILTPISYDGDSIYEGDSRSITVQPNSYLRPPLLEIEGVIEGYEDVPVPLLSIDNGVIKADLKGSGLGQTLQLELSDIPAGSRIVKIDPQAPEKHLDLNIDDSGTYSSTLILDYKDWKNTFWVSPKNQSGDFQLAVNAISVDNYGNTKSTEVTPIQIILKPVNDYPNVIKYNDLKTISEGETGIWNLKQIFNDIDNESKDLQIKIELNDSINKGNLPKWLHLEENGLLTGTPSNEDVGFYKFDITATDPLGESTTISINLNVGDLNKPPLFLSDKLVEDWEINAQSNNVLCSRNFKLREHYTLNLLDVFKDEDLINGDLLHYQISTDLIQWTDKYKNLAILNDTNLIINPLGKDTVGNHNLYLRAFDKRGTSTSIQLSINVLNINDSPHVNRDSAIELRTGVWKESVEVNEDDVNWELNLEGLFSDLDILDNIEEISPLELPPWLSYIPSKVSTGGLLIANPKNSDVGIHQLQWQALDNKGGQAIYNLELRVINTNDKPILIEHPNFSELGETRNERIQLLEDNKTELDLSEVFFDPDLRHGDKLEYSIESILKLGNNETPNTDWLRISNKSSITPEVIDQFLIEPAIYTILENGDIGVRLDSDAYKNLKDNTKLRVIVEASDYRNIDNKGLIGVDLDLELSKSLEIVEGSIYISDSLPLFQSISPYEQGFRVQAASAPDGSINVGKAVGEFKQDKLLSFDLIVVDSSSNHIIDLRPGIGLLRDGIIGRTGEDIRHGSNAIIHSFASEAGSSLEADSPSNADVGIYSVVIKASDQLGETISKTLELEVVNQNDSPTINLLERNLFQEWISQTFEENKTYNTNLSDLFVDSDKIFGDTIELSLIDDDRQDKNSQSIIKLTTIDQNNIELSIKPQSGLLAEIEQRIKLKATDNLDESIETDWFNILYRPSAQVTDIISSLSDTVLGKEQLGNLVKKNINIDLQAALNINAPILKDDQGDNAELNIYVKASGAKLSLKNHSNQDFYQSELHPNGATTFIIDFDQLSQITGNQYGDLTGLELKTNHNQLDLIPDSINNSYKLGLPIKIFTTTKVKGDEENVFGTANSPEATIWIPVLNSKPVFQGSEALLIDKKFFANANNSNHLFDLSKLFIDTDEGEISEWSLEIPKELSELVEINNKTGIVSFTNAVRTIQDIPEGYFKIFVRQKDGSAIIGDDKGIASGILRLNIKHDSSIDTSTSGLEIFKNGNTSHIKSILSSLRTGNTLSNVEEEVINIFDRFKVSDDKQDQLISKLEKGSLSILGEDIEKDNLLIIDSSTHEGSILIDAEKSQEKAFNLLENINHQINHESVKAPIGEIDFSIDTQGADTSVVNIYLDDQPYFLDKLIKTTSDGIPYLFKSKILDYNANQDGELADWLSELEYSLYYYDPYYFNSKDQISNVKLRAEDNLFEELSFNNIDFGDIKSIDGSAYLIDLDSDGTVDLISMLLVDQGFFDTIDEKGIIGDPLIPIETTAPVKNVILPNKNSSNPSIQNSDITSNSNRSTSENIIQQNSFIGDINELKNTFQLSQKQSIPNTFSPKEEIVNISQEGNNLSPVNIEDYNLDNTMNINNSKPKRNTFDDVKNYLRNHLPDNLYGASIASIIGLMVGPMLVERISSLSIKKINKDYRLKYKRRNINFTGEWFIPKGNNKFIKVSYINSMIKHTNITIDINNNQELSMIPGFSEEGSSLLFSSLTSSHEPGKLLRSLISYKTKLEMSGETDVNWIKWLYEHFPPTDISSKANKSNKSLHALSKLIVENYTNNLELLDVFMYAQIINTIDKIYI